MKNKFLTLVIAFISICTYAQDQFQKGYFIDNDNQKVNCLIKNMDWKYNPTEFIYKLNETSEEKKATINTVKVFEIIDISKYVRKTVYIDKSSIHINKLTELRDPSFEEETFFLKVLIEGNANLYAYEKRSFIRFFYEVNNNEIKQLIYKEYKTSDYIPIVKENNDFRKQIYEDLKSRNITITNTLNLKYNQKSLIKKFVQYNKDTQQDYTIYKNTTKRDLFNLALKVGVDYSSVLITNNNLFPGIYYDIDAGNTTKLRYGVEFEYIMPFNNNKWAITFEPTYQYFKKKYSGEHELKYSTNIPHKTDVDYKSIELPVGIRRYFYLNKESKLFMNAALIFDYNLNNSQIIVQRHSAIERLDITSKNFNFSLGLGYNYNKKLSIEARYYSPRELLRQQASKGSKYKNLSLVLGYSIF